MYIEQPFTESDSIKVIQMNEQISNLQGQTATMSGWGKSEKESWPDLLSQYSAQIQMDGDDHNGMGILRMPNTEGSGVCQGDSGGNAFKFFLTKKLNSVKVVDGGVFYSNLS